MKNVFGLNNHLNQTVGFESLLTITGLVSPASYLIPLNLSFSICKMGVTVRIACVKPTIQPSA